MKRSRLIAGVLALIMGVSSFPTASVMNVSAAETYVAEEAEGRINGTVESLVFKGVHYEMIVKSDDGIEWLVQNVDPSAVGSRVGLYVDPDDIQIMRRSELSPEFGSFGIKHQSAEESSEAKEAKSNSIGENVVEEADIKKDEDAEESAEVEKED